MKSIWVKLIAVCLLAGALATFGPLMMPRVNQAFAPALVDKPESVLPPPGVKRLAKVEDLVFDLTNQIRRAKGLAPLIKDHELRDVARAFSDDMLVRRFFDHTTPDELSFDERISHQYPHWVRFIGENIWSAWGCEPGNAQTLAQEIVHDWMISPTHRANVLDPDFTHLGVGVSVRRQAIRATQEFVGRSKAFGCG
jgi:uncharacterized protein YkwD